MFKVNMLMKAMVLSCFTLSASYSMDGGSLTMEREHAELVKQRVTFQENTDKQLREIKIKSDVSDKIMVLGEAFRRDAHYVSDVIHLIFGLFMDLTKDNAQTEFLKKIRVGCGVKLMPEQLLTQRYPIAAFSICKAMDLIYKLQEDPKYLPEEQELTCLFTVCDAGRRIDLRVTTPTLLNPGVSSWKGSTKAQNLRALEENKNVSFDIETLCFGGWWVNRLFTLSCEEVNNTLWTLGFTKLIFWSPDCVAILSKKESKEESYPEK